MTLLVESTPYWRLVYYVPLVSGSRIMHLESTTRLSWGRGSFRRLIAFSIREFVYDLAKEARAFAREAGKRKHGANHEADQIIPSSSKSAKSAKSCRRESERFKTQVRLDSYMMAVQERLIWTISKFYRSVSLCCSTCKFSFVVQTKGLCSQDPRSKLGPSLVVEFLTH